MAYFNGKKIPLKLKLVVVEGGDYNEGYNEGHVAGYEEGTTETRSKFQSILDRSVTEITAEMLTGLTELGLSACYDCKNLTTVVIPEPVRVLRGAAFQNCTALSSVKLPATLQYVEYSVFNGCTSLTELTIPGPFKQVATKAFYIGEGAVITCLSKIPGAMSSTGFNPDTLGKILAPLRWEDLYKAATNWSAFADYIEGDASIVTYITGDELSALGISVVANSMFKDFSNLEYVEIPEGITSIGDYAFQNCTALKEVTIPESVAGAELGKYAFYECEALEEVTLPSKLTKIRGCCFLGCVDLKKVTIPEGVILIGGHAFYKCESLRELTLPESVKYLEENSLGIGTPENKATIIMKSKTPPPISTTNIFRTDCVEKIIVPVGCGAVYRSATNWSLIADDIEIEEEEE